MGKKQTDEQNGSSFWKVVKSFITYKGHHNGLDLTLLEDGRIITDHGEVAEIMNIYYINVAVHIRNKTIKQDSFVDRPSIKAMKTIWHLTHLSRLGILQKEKLLKL